MTLKHRILKRKILIKSIAGKIQERNGYYKEEIFPQQKIRSILKLEKQVSIPFIGIVTG